MEFLILNKNDMKKVITMKEVIAADKVALNIYSNGSKDIPLRTNLNIEKENGNSLFMPGYSKDSDSLGLKIVSVYPNNYEKGLDSVPSSMVLLDEKTGILSCIMDGTYLTELRTGALSGLATDLLSKKDAKNFLIIGTGGQAKTQVEAVLAVREIQNIKVFDINKDKAQKFVEMIKTELLSNKNITIEVSENLDKDTSEADIITTVTTSKEPVFNGNMIREGVHINAVGSYTKEMSEIPKEAIAKATLVYVDTIDAFTESGDFHKYNFDRSIVTGELGELIASKKMGRENDKQITFFETTGNAILDIVVAKKIYENAIKNNLGKLIQY